jgi:hypothetical protein
VEVAPTAEALPEDKFCAKVNQDTKVNQDLRGVSITPRDIQKDPQQRATLDIVHPDRTAQVQSPDNDISSLDIDDFQPANIVKETEKFSSISRKDLKAAFKQCHNNLSRTRSGKVIKPITKKQRNYLQGLSKDMIVEYLENRKQNLRSYASKYIYGS